MFSIEPVKKTNVPSGLFLVNINIYILIICIDDMNIFIYIFTICIDGMNSYNEWSLWSVGTMADPITMKAGIESERRRSWWRM